MENTLRCGQLSCLAKPSETFISDIFCLKKYDRFTGISSSCINSFVLVQRDESKFHLFWRKQAIWDSKCLTFWATYRSSFNSCFPVGEILPSMRL
mmetsp:Transcript_1522/g.1835  ORF Transcript_1522/g.1835 Transcript_1522/m.1835 type:complete len:95 (+) Transcript_1522:1864-2148(+)